MKKFFRPTVIKIVITILIAASHILIIGIGWSCGWSNATMKEPLCRFLGVPFMNILMLPSDFISRVLQIRLNPFETNANPIFSIGVQIIWSYVLASGVTSIFRKIFKKSN